MEKFPKYERIHPRSLDEIVKDMNAGKTPPEFESSTDVHEETESAELTTERLSYFIGQIDSICTLTLPDKSEGEQRAAIRFALNKKRGMAEGIDRDYRSDYRLKKGDPDANPAASYLEKRLQEFQ